MRLIAAASAALLALACPAFAETVVPTVSATTEASHVICTSSCNLYGFSVSIGATSGYVLVIDATSDPGNGSVTPKKCYPVTSNGTNGAVAANWNPASLRLSTGLVLVFSTTGCFTETTSATAFFSAEAK